MKYKPVENKSPLLKVFSETNVSVKDRVERAKQNMPDLVEDYDEWLQDSVNKLEKYLGDLKNAPVASEILDAIAFLAFEMRGTSISFERKATATVANSLHTVAEAYSKNTVEDELHEILQLHYAIMCKLIQLEGNLDEQTLDKLIKGLLIAADKCLQKFNE